VKTHPEVADLEFDDDHLDNPIWLSPGDVDGANRLFLAWRIAGEEAEEALAAIDAEIERLTKRRLDLLSLARRRQEHCAAVLGHYLEHSGRKRVELAYGRLSWQHPRARVRFVDADGEISDDPSHFLAGQPTECYVRTTVTQEPDKIAIAKALRDGDVVHGAILDAPGRPTLKIALAKSEPDPEPEARDDRDVPTPTEPED